MSRGTPFNPRAGAGQPWSKSAVVVFLDLEVLSELGNPLTEDRYLHFRGTSILLVNPVGSYHPAFDVYRQCHLEWMLLVFS
jgi:hypothetical protein